MAAASSTPSYNVPLPPLPPGLDDVQVSNYLTSLRQWLQDLVTSVNSANRRLSAQLGPASIITNVSGANANTAAVPLSTLFTINAYLADNGVMQKTNTNASSWALQFDTVGDTADVLYSSPGTLPITWTAVNSIGGGPGNGTVTQTYHSYTLDADEIFFNPATLFTINGNTTFGGTGTVTFQEPVSMTSTLQVTGLATMGNVSASNISDAGTLMVTGTSTLGVVNAGDVSATNVTDSGNISVTGNSSVTGTSTFTGLGTFNGGLTAGGLVADTHGNVIAGNASTTTATDGFPYIPGWAWASYRNSQNGNGLLPALGGYDGLEAVHLHRRGLALDSTDVITYTHRLAQVRDWPLLLAFWEKWCRDTTYGDRLDCDLETIEGFVGMAQTFPKSFGVVVSCEGADPSRIFGIALLMTVNSPHKLYTIPRTFIHGILADPTGPRKASDALMAGMMAWGQARGHDLLWGNIRLPHGIHDKNGFKLRAVEKRYGMTVAHLVLIRDIPKPEVSQNGQGN